MQTENLSTNTLPAAAYDWYLTYLEALDAKDLDAYGAYLADDVTLQMNDQPPMVGKDAVLGGLAAYWPSFGSLEHDLLTLMGDERHLVLEALNHYTRLDGHPVTVRAVAFTDRDAEGLVTSVRLYSDTSPLYATG